MRTNKLKLNDEKTEFFIASSDYNSKFIHDITINIGNSIIQQSPTIKNLGIVFDRPMSMSEHVKSIIKSVNFHLRNIYRIRRFITFENSLLYGISSIDKKRLQTLQNRAARIVFRVNRRHPSAPLRNELHWLPVDSRIVFKLMLLTFKSFHDLLPHTFLSSLLLIDHHGKTSDLATIIRSFKFRAPNDLPVITVLAYLRPACGTHCPFISVSPLRSSCLKRP
jgi:hypothetical protein